MHLPTGGHKLANISLEPQLDEAFAALYDAYCRCRTPNFESFVASTRQFFDTNRCAFELHDKYFQNFSALAEHFRLEGRSDEAEKIWKLALEAARVWEEDNPEYRIHKGTPYYFLSMLAILRGDLDQGYLLMHTAAREDIETEKKKNPDTPALKFACLRYDEERQAFRQWLQAQADFIEVLIDHYSAEYKTSFGLQPFTEQFLLKLQISEGGLDLLFMFAYTVARLMRFSAFNGDVVHTGFASQIEVNLLFDLALVIEGTMKLKDPSGAMFKQRAESLLKQAEQPLLLKDVNTAFRKDWDGTLATVLDLSLADGTELSVLQRDVCVTYGIRNFAAHEVGSLGAIERNFKQVQQSVFNVLFSTVQFYWIT